MIVYTPKGVCSVQIIVDLDGDVVKEVQFIGGCSGNAQGVSRLVTGMKVNDVIKRLKGIRCGFKQTSCPDQLCTALELALKDQTK
jgi:uncharacterized protein (TIGR03905 family)